MIDPHSRYALFRSPEIPGSSDSTIHRVDCRLGGQGQPEVENLDLAVWGHHHVSGFDISMNKSSIVNVLQPQGDFANDTAGGLHAERFFQA
jgi:hypothetical protein